MLFYHSRSIIDELICSKINSKYGIKLSLDKPLNNDMELNITRPAVLRQYYGLETSICNDRVERYTYGSGTGTTSVGMDPDNFVTRTMNQEMLEMSSHIYKMLCENKNIFNLKDVDMKVPFNHCTVLIYYAGEGLKKHSKLGYHTDCVYSPATGKYKETANSQVNNTPAIIYSIGSTRKLNFKKRRIGENENGRKIWLRKDKDRITYEIGSDTISIINPLDENPMSQKNYDELSQYLHGGIDVSGEKLSVAFVFRVVKDTKFYNLCDDTLFCTESNCGGNVVTGVLGFDLGSYHRNLRSLYSKILL